MPREALKSRRSPPARQRCRRKATSLGLRLRDFKTTERSAIPKNTLLEETKNGNGPWSAVEPAHRFFGYFLAFLDRLAHGPMGPKTRPLGPWAHSSEIEGDRREKVCN